MRVTFRDDLADCLQSTLRIAAFFSVAMIVLWAVRGGDLPRHLSMFSVLAIYFIGALLVGFLMAFLRPIRVRFWGALVIGILAMGPLTAGILMAVLPPDLWVPWFIFKVSLYTALFLGPIYGGWFWYLARE
jgi:hypothetical protein